MSEFDLLVAIAVSLIVLKLPMMWYGIGALAFGTFYFFGPAIFFAVVFRRQVWQAWGKNLILHVNIVDRNGQMQNYYYPCNGELENWFRQNNFKKSLFYAGYIGPVDRMEEVGRGLQQFNCEYKTIYL
ncbi:MAG: hypothetical protein HY226_06765 [Candidatus Vogelbacteria bacterium]|nr:hypothetical protein [Candidatus Vogelbacteria bacterium]